MFASLANPDVGHFETIVGRRFGLETPFSQHGPHSPRNGSVTSHIQVIDGSSASFRVQIQSCDASDSCVLWRSDVFHPQSKQSPWHQHAIPVWFIFWIVIPFQPLSDRSGGNEEKNHRYLLVSIVWEGSLVLATILSVTAADAIRVVGGW
jgi:hypothetical protein